MPSHREADPHGATPHHPSPDPAGGLGDLHRQVARLRMATGLLALVLITVVVVGAARPLTTSGVIRAERIEIVEPDGTLALVLANSARPAVATLDGVPILAGQEEERRNPSFIFFDGKGDEVGGMLFRNEATPEGGVAVRHLSLDGYKQDQTVVLHHYQDPRGTHAGLSVSDRPQDASLADAFRGLGLDMPVDRADLEEAMMAIPAAERGPHLASLFGGANRVFVGTTRSGQAVLHLSDAQGRRRVALGVADDGPAFLRLYNADGSVAWEMVADGG